MFYPSLDYQFGTIGEDSCTFQTKAPRKTKTMKPSQIISTSTTLKAATPPVDEKTTPDSKPVKFTASTTVKATSTEEFISSVGNKTITSTDTSISSDVTTTLITKIAISDETAAITSTTMDLSETTRAKKTSGDSRITDITFKSSSADEKVGYTVETTKNMIVSHRFDSVIFRPRQSQKKSQAQ
jgi:hypothetical protein